MKRIFAAGAALCLLLFSLVAFSGTASAKPIQPHHTPGRSASCDGVIATGNSYSKSDSNWYSIQIDGVAVVPQTYFDTSFSAKADVPQDGVSHTWKVKVRTSADPDGSKGYSVTYDGSVGPCGPPPFQTVTHTCYWLEGVGAGADSGTAFNNGPQTLIHCDGDVPVPACDRVIQVDNYVLDTPEKLAAYQALIDRGVLYSSASDGSFVVSWHFISGAPCVIITPTTEVTPTTPTTETTPSTETSPTTDSSTPTTLSSDTPSSTETTPTTDSSSLPPSTETPPTSSSSLPSTSSSVLPSTDTSPTTVSSSTASSTIVKTTESTSSVTTTKETVPSSSVIKTTPGSSTSSIASTKPSTGYPVAVTTVTKSKPSQSVTSNLSKAPSTSSQQVSSSTLVVAPPSTENLIVKPLASTGGGPLSTVFMIGAGIVIVGLGILFFTRKTSRQH